MSEKKPIVIRNGNARPNCPICGKPSYSSTGTHPQCAVARADAVTRAARKEAEPQMARTPRKTWSKPCPKCKREIPARRYVCDCGHQFVAAPQQDASPV